MAEEDKTNCASVTRCDTGPKKDARCGWCLLFVGGVLA